MLIALLIRAGIYWPRYVHLAANHFVQQYPYRTIAFVDVTRRTDDGIYLKICYDEEKVVQSPRAHVIYFFEHSSESVGMVATS